MNLTDLNIDISYITFGERNIKDHLIIPALGIAKTYRRSVGYFSTSVFESILDGIMNLVQNDGIIQIIAGPKISEKDIEAISLGYEMREAIVKKAFLKDFENAVSCLDDEKLILATQLIAEGILDIRITDLSNSSSFGCYHDKFGIIEDEYRNKIVFVGSANETENGLKNNYEKIRVFRSWNTSQYAYVKDEIDEFDQLWNGENQYLKTYEFGDALKKKILKIRDTVCQQSHKETNEIKLRDYQIEAIDAWRKNDNHGFFVMATGTGKTWTAIFAAKELIIEKPCMLVIIAPYKHLIKQWAGDIKTAFPKAKVVLVSSENLGWNKQITDLIIEQRMNSDTQIILISTIKSFGSDTFKKTIKKSKEEKILIVDEAHRFKNLSAEIKTTYQYLLGLSATPFSGKSAQKGLELMGFFGGKVFELTLEEALERGYLVPYYYHPIFVHTTSEEEEQFKKHTKNIISCFRGNVCINPELCVREIRNRLRIIAMAEEKLLKIESILNCIQVKDHFIVYCGDGRCYSDDGEQIRHINYVKKALAKLGHKVSQFTAKESMNERMELVNLFNDGAINSLAAIRCLDEGINIPSIKSALILSSNDDYREFTQRRGRILRLFPGKDCAHIYDVVVLPSKDCVNLATIELRRYTEYARLALNSKDELEHLTDLLNEYEIPVEEIEFNYDDWEEGEELDD